MKPLSALFCLLLPLNSLALAPPPVNFEVEFFEVEGETYRIRYDKETGILHVPEKIETDDDYQSTGCAWIVIFLGTPIFWFFFLKWLWNYLF